MLPSSLDAVGSAFFLLLLLFSRCRGMGGGGNPPWSGRVCKRKRTNLYIYFLVFIYKERRCKSQRGGEGESPEGKKTRHTPYPPQLINPHLLSPTHPPPFFRRLFLFFFFSPLYFFSPSPLPQFSPPPSPLCRSDKKEKKKEKTGLCVCVCVCTVFPVAGKGGLCVSTTGCGVILLVTQER